jgi:sugar phosphate isomerase/epimerase
MHPRVTIHDHVFPRDETLRVVLAGFARGGAERIGIGRGKFESDGWEVGAAMVRDSGLDLTHVVHGSLFPLQDASAWDVARARAIDTLDAAARLGARCVYGVTGSAMSLSWEDAADAFVVASGPVAAHARGVGVPLLIEPTNMLFANVGFLHTLRDTVDLAREAGLGVCLDVQHCWCERGLGETIRRASDSIGLVQLSDYIPGRRDPYRAVPGDGVIPLERIIAAVLEVGYGGLFDLELYGEPGVDPADTIARASDRVSTMLDRLGA